MRTSLPKPADLVRRGARNRCARLLESLHRVLNELDDEGTEADRVQALAAQVDTFWVAGFGKRLRKPEIDSLMTLLILGALEDASRSSDPLFANRMARGLVRRWWPDVAARLPETQLNAALRAWHAARHADRRSIGRAKKESSKWRTALALLREAGLSPPATLKSKWAAWRRDNPMTG